MFGKIDWSASEEVFELIKSKCFLFLYGTDVCPRWTQLIDIHYSLQLEGKYSLESTDPRESEIRAHLRP